MPGWLDPEPETVTECDADVALSELKPAARRYTTQPIKY